MNYYNENTILYFNGKLVKASEARFDFYSQSLQYGYAVFEGIRSYRTADGRTKIFKAEPHFDRLRNSAEAMNLPYNWDRDELIAATYTLLEKNKLENAYIRPLVFAPPNMTLNRNKESGIIIAVWEMAPFLGEKLLRIKTSSFQRPNPRGFKIEAKASGHYVNSLLASHEAKDAGYDEALLLDMNGNLAEGPGANIFFEKDGKLFTPALGNILPGITRATVLELCAEWEIPVTESILTPEDIKTADAAFFCGTATEIIGWESLDDVKFPKPWGESVSRLIQDAYRHRITEKEFNPSFV